MKKKFYINFLFIGLITYLSLAAIGAKVADKSEFFPFYHWGLYRLIPQTIDKAYLDIYLNESLTEKKSFYDLVAQLEVSRFEAQSMLNKFKLCIETECFESSKKNITKVLPTNSYSVFYIINEKEQVDTLGIFKNKIFQIR